MTVAELIAKLKEMPQDLQVITHADDDFDTTLRFVQLIPWVTGSNVYLGSIDMQEVIDALEPSEESGACGEAG